MLDQRFLQQEKKISPVGLDISDHWIRSLISIFSAVKSFDANIAIISNFVLNVKILNMLVYVNRVFPI